MIATEFFSSPPPAVTVCNLPGGGADIWMRRNIQKVECSADPGETTSNCWTAEVVYMRTAGAQDAASIQAQFAAWWDKAVAWSSEDSQPQDIEQRVAELETLFKDAVSWQSLSAAVNDGVQRI